MSRFRTGVVFVVVALAGGLVPVVLTGGSEAAAAAPTCVLPPPSGGIISLTGDCDTTVPLIIPDGITINGNGHTITAHDPTGGFFTGAVLANAGTTMNVENLTIQGTGFATNCAGILTGIFFDNAGGSVTGVTVTGITQHSGCQLGLGIRANALNGVPQTVTIAKTTVTDYQKGGLVASGMMTMNVSGSTVGPPDSLDGTIAQNGVQYGGTGSRKARGERSPPARSPAAASVVQPTTAPRSCCLPPRT